MCSLTDSWLFVTSSSIFRNDTRSIPFTSLRRCTLRIRILSTNILSKQFFTAECQILAWDPEWMLSNSTVLKSTFLDGIRSVVSIFTEFIFRFYTHEITSIDSIQQWSAGLSLNDACRYTSWRLDFSEYLLQRIIIEVNHAVSNKQVYYIHIIYSYETLFTSKW